MYLHQQGHCQCAKKAPKANLLLLQTSFYAMERIYWGMDEGYSFIPISEIKQADPM